MQLNLFRLLNALPYLVAVQLTVQLAKLETNLWLR